MAVAVTSRTLILIYLVCFISPETVWAVFAGLYGRVRMMISPLYGEAWILFGYRRVFLALRARLLETG
jgi:hypothetical protein